MDCERFISFLKYYQCYESPTTISVLLCFTTARVFRLVDATSEIYDSHLAM